MKSFSLIRTNPALTTNLKLIVSSNYDMYLETFNSNSELANSKFKHFRINKDVYYDEVLPKFFKDVPVETAFAIQDDNDEDKMYDDFDKQFDDIYWAGCQAVPDTFYQEEFEAFAPLYINKQEMPTNFIIFRVDGSGIDSISKDNFRTNILEKFKVVKVFDLVNSDLGEFIKKNITTNNYYPERPLELDVRTYEFTKWNGIDYETGGYTQKSLFLEDFLENSNLFYDFDKTITDGYKNNKIVFPHIWNLTYLFDDTPATKTSLRKWSINRYYGFYLNSMDVVFKGTFYQPEKLQTNLQIITDNILVDTDGNSIDPTIRGWRDDRYYYIEYNGEFYPMIRYFENDNYVYKIISELDLSGKESDINKNILNIDSSNYLTFNINYNNITFDISNFSDADVWIISIGDKYHRLLKDSNGYYLHTDYGFNLSISTLEFYINAPNSEYSTKINLNDIDQDTKPISIQIFRLNFTDVKDFDNQIKETDFAKYEYEQFDSITDTIESKFYRFDYNSVKNPRDLETFTYQNNTVNIPAASEYSATSELFVNTNDGNLIELWRKNQNWVKWGYQNSLSAYDSSYRLNNSLTGEDFNRTVNTVHSTPIESERNLDYFYTINASTSSYVFQSLHINMYTGSTVGSYSIDYNAEFEIDKYFNADSYTGSYFDYIFSKKEYPQNGSLTRNTNKYSQMNDGDNDYPNSTLFRGLKFNFYNNKSVIRDGADIKSITLEPTNDLNDYKFSILLSSYDKDINNSFTPSTNTLSWYTIPEFTNGLYYATSSTVIWNGILFDALQQNLNNDPNFSPTNSSFWTYSALTPSIFWRPALTYSTNDVIYNSGDYWYRTTVNTSTASDIWNPTRLYQPSTYVLHNAALYKSNAITNKEPGLSTTWDRQTSFSSWGNKWNLVENWDVNLSYNTNSIVNKNGIVYKANATTVQDPSSNLQTTWDRIYSLIPDTDIVYTATNSNIIELNNTLYVCTANTGSSTLDNGINIYINKKWNNILINIYINDNTTNHLKNSNRSDLYTTLNSKLTAKNFIDCINDIENSYGFTNDLTYYIIEDDLTFSSYDKTNIEGCPYIIRCESAEDLLVRLKSYFINPISFNFSLIKIINKLDNNIINDINQLNYYNGSPLSFKWQKNNNDISLVDNFSGIKNSNYAQIYRFNGFYSPICKDIELFKAYDIYDNLIGNYKFDETLSNFGEIRERIYSKVNIKGSQLRLTNYRNVKSVYPIIDECGYSLGNFFSFRSTWDNNYYITNELIKN